jgi:hypothetical protein
VGEKKKVYNALVEGATDGLTDKALFAFVRDKRPKTKSKVIVRASLLALSDPDLRDRNVLNAIYALAIKHRLDGRSADDSDGDETTDESLVLPQNSAEPGKKARSGKSPRITKKTESREDTPSL